MSDRELYEAILKAKQGGQSVILATIIHDQGSVPRHIGSKMLLGADGAILAGTIGGGEMENRVIQEALDLLKKGQPGTLHYELAEPSRGDPGVCGGQVDLFLEPIMPDPTVLVVGCGHVGQAVVELAHWLGFHVTACDDREDLCNPQAVPFADKYVVCQPEDITANTAIHAQSYVAVLTRGVPFDVAMLPQLLETPAPYIGVIGSRRRWATTVKKLTEKGFDETALARVHAPIGLELQAETPREIAVSILAEIIAQQKRGTGKPMKRTGASKETGAKRSAHADVR